MLVPAGCQKRSRSGFTEPEQVPHHRHNLRPELWRLISFSEQHLHRAAPRPQHLLAVDRADERGLEQRELVGRELVAASAFDLAEL